jgi:hypothetical protein
MNPDELKERLRRPTETLQQELKSWVGLDSPVDRARIARALIALRNRNGGSLVFGFDNSTLTPAEQGMPADVRSFYHPDKLQKLVTDYIEPAFPITVEFGDCDGKEFPVVVVPSGVKSPAMGRQDVKNDKGDKVLRQNAVYVRSANNNVVQTTEPRSAQDWDELMRICFDNRESDVGRFLRRNLGSILDELGLKPKGEPPAPTPPPSDGPSGPIPPISPTAALAGAGPALPARSPESVIDEGAVRFAARAEFLAKRPLPVKLPDHKAWRETGIVLTGPIRPLLGQYLTQAVFPRHPKLSGWPLWIDSRGLGGELEQPYPAENGWEALVTMSEGAFVKGMMVDFWRIDPRGEFYHRRSLEDDLWARIPEGNRGTTFDIINAIKRVAETLATVQAFAQGMSVDPEAATLRAAFRWTNLQARKLISIEPGRDFFAPTAAYEDVARSSVEMPVSAASGAIASYVNQAVTPLFATFGYQVPRFVVDELATTVLKFNSR